MINAFPVPSPCPPSPNQPKFLPPPAAPLSVLTLNIGKVVIEMLKIVLEYCKHVLTNTSVDSVDEKKLAERIQALKKEKDDALTRVSALQKQVGPPPYNIQDIYICCN